MKKQLTIIAAISLAVVSVQAQGLVNFANSSSAGSKVSTNAVVGGSASGLTGATAGTFYYALFSSAATTVSGVATSLIPTGTTQPTGSFGALGDANWHFQGYATNSATVGRVAGPLPLTLNGVLGGATLQFVVLGWSANLGLDLASLTSSLNSALPQGTVAWLGESAVSVPVTVGDGGSVPTPAIMAASGAVPGFTVGLIPTSVPEPATMALAALGGASLLMLRRKK